MKTIPEQQAAYVKTLPFHGKQRQLTSMPKLSKTTPKDC